MSLFSILAIILVLIHVYSFCSRPSREYCHGRLDQCEVNYHCDVVIVGKSHKKVFGFYRENPPELDGCVTEELQNNRKNIGETGVIVSFSKQGHVRIIKHRDGTQAAYHYHELSFSKKHYEDLGFKNIQNI